MAMRYYPPLTAGAGWIWRDSGLYQHSRALDVHVQRLRKKIESDIENPQYIVTVAGVGYKFQAG